MGSSTTSSQGSLEHFVNLDNPWMHHNLALEHWHNFEQSGELEELKKSIAHNRTALELCPKGHPKRSGLLNNSALSLRTQHKYWGQLDSLEESIELDRAALELRPEDHPHRSNSLNNLALSLRILYEAQGRTKDLEEAIDLHRAALELRPKGNPDRSISLSNLAHTLQTRYNRWGQSEDLEESLELDRAALELRSGGHPDRSVSLNNLANSLRGRYERQGRTDDLEDAIRLHRAALELRREGHPDRCTSLGNLANSLGIRYEQEGRTWDLEESIDLHQAALELRREGHPNRSISLGNLAVSLRTRYQQQGRMEDLEEVISLHLAAVQLQPEGHPLRSISLSNLASSLTTRYEQKGRTKDLKDAIKLHRAALELRPDGHPSRSASLWGLANAIYARIEKRGHMEGFEECMQLLELAATHEFSGLLVRLPAARRWVTLARSRNHISTFAAYKATTSILQYALSINPTLHTQHDFLLRNGDHRMLSLDAASYAIEKNELEHAIEILEQGRGLLWSQLRGLRTPLDQLAETNKGLADRFRDVGCRLEDLTTSHEALASGSTMDGGESLGLGSRSGRKSFDDLLRLKKQLSNEQDVVINEIRHIPGFENFLEVTPFDILHQAAAEYPVIVVNHCKYRCDALIILPRDDLPVVCVPLDERFYGDSVQLCNEFVETRQRFSAGSLEYDEKLREAMSMVWDRVVSGVVDKLTEVGVVKGSRIWWCPTSVLSALPFHAAGPFKDADGTTKYLLDDYISSYTPTLSALINARSRAVTIRPNLLIVGDTATLPSTRQEIRNIRNCLGDVKSATTLLLDRRASRRTVMKMLQKVTWVHFACHGHLDPKPFDSSFKLSDRNLTLLDVIRANVPNAEFAFLSACHTAELSHSGAHDEALHLSAAMQFSGFRSVIGTMWELFDEDGPHFARVVYEYMNECEDDDLKYKRAAVGLRKAALELRAKDGIPTERWVNFVHMGA